ncbi:uncharacterized protein LOC129587934 [Paramacrobiotus metropolitanus]|uniref:uncharacterized protein LOC129587934 n=1 Tax=Paramacrobiotus metropolitanus TaxID=2943436 RepID=UPI002445F63C|nr:uncharacterized protein LOC129587934 [Paramacrobiotus metropolitanus]
MHPFLSVCTLCALFTCCYTERLVLRKPHPQIIRNPPQEDQVVLFEEKDDADDFPEHFEDETTLLPEAVEHNGDATDEPATNGSTEAVTFTMEQPPTSRPPEDIPRGPILAEESLERKYAKKFNENAAEKVVFYEPQLLPNCWMQSMLASHNEFTPQCNQDGSFASKQCFLQRCWCTNRDGSAQVQSNRKRFFFGIRGITLRCTQNGIPI